MIDNEITKLPTCSKFTEEKIEAVLISKIDVDEPKLKLTFHDPRDETFNAIIINITPTHINGSQSLKPNKFLFGKNLNKAYNDYNFPEEFQKLYNFSIKYLNGKYYLLNFYYKGKYFIYTSKSAAAVLTRLNPAKPMKIDQVSVFNLCGSVSIVIKQLEKSRLLITRINGNKRNEFTYDKKCPVIRIGREKSNEIICKYEGFSKIQCW